MLRSEMYVLRSCHPPNRGQKGPLLILYMRSIRKNVNVIANYSHLQDDLWHRTRSEPIRTQRDPLVHLALVSRA